MAMVAVALVSCSSGSTSTTTTRPSKALIAWVGVNRSTLDAMSGAASTFTGRRARRLHTVKPACEDLARLVRKAKAAGSVPAAAVNRHWQRSVTLYRSAASSCASTFSSDAGPGALVRALELLDNAAPDLKVVTTAAP